jgi:hypothetical protein
MPDEISNLVSDAVFFAAVAKELIDFSAGPGRNLRQHPGITLHLA